MEERKQCLNCGCWFKRRPPENYIAYAKRMFCSIDCRWNFHRRILPIDGRSCLWCKKRLEKKENEKISRYNKRKFCGRSCSGKAAVKPNICGRDDKGMYFSANPSIHASRNKARRKIEDVDCSICGSKENRVVHHKDGNPHNNELDNLQVLCTKCHVHLHKGLIDAN